jgi:PPE-repeat protein
MTVALDFATLPPEVNSARMYSGAGSGPMLAAASAWHGTAAELRSTALSYGSVLTALTGQEWHGPASAAMSAAAAPYVAWLGTTAEQAEQTAAQAEAAAAAYDAAFAATVPPPVIAVNRAQLMALIATNILGQNTPAIAATEAQYGEMWAQDAAAMYGYAASSAVATQLSEFTGPQQTTNPSGLTAQSAAAAHAGGAAAGSEQSTLSQVMSAIPTALQGLASSTGSASAASEPSGILGTLGSNSMGNEIWAVLQPNSNFWNTITSTGLGMAPVTALSALTSLGGGGATAGVSGSAVGQAVTGALAGPLGGVSGLGGLGGTVSASFGKAASIGTLSAPPSWTAAAPLHSPLASTMGGTPMIAPQGAAGMPGMPIGGLGAQASGRAMPQYGFRPSFVPRPPAAG